jgi:hypothetical protein
MSTSRPRSLMVALALALLAPTAAHAQGPSAGDVAQARDLLNEGETLRDQGDLPHALEKLQAADALLHTPITALELARTFMMAGKLVEARETFLGVARIAVSREETSRSKAARAQAEKLAEEIRPKIPVRKVRVTGVALDTVAIAIDGAAIPTGAVAAPRRVNPGSHVVRATSTAGGEAETTVAVNEGETRDVELKIAFATGVPTATPATATPAPPAPESSGGVATTSRGATQRVVGIVLGATGLVAMGTAGAMTLVAKGQYDTAAGESFPARHTDSASATNLANAASVTFGVGAAALVAGAVVWWTAPKGSVAVGTNGREVLLTGTF